MIATCIGGNRCNHIGQIKSINHQYNGKIQPILLTENWNCFTKPLSLFYQIEKKPAIDINDGLFYLL